jgi:outer membrane cobalamin receptor
MIMRHSFICMGLALAALLVVPARAQHLVSGTIVDATSGESLPGANVRIETTGLGAVVQADGSYVIRDVASGTYSITASFIGFQPVTQTVRIVGDTEVNFTLEVANAALEQIEVFASRAQERRTPVAFSNVDTEQIQRQLGSRDVPMVLNVTPSVYATQQGGGAGDARINVRGFDQRNIAIMINGIPVNDMENGWVYWSNWDGVGDAASSIQLQRGLSAVNLATPSIGGTLNILTDPAQLNSGVTVKQEAGSGNFLKTSITASTGLINNRFAATAVGVRKTGDGIIDGTWTDAWAYLFAAAYNINSRNRLDFSIVGAPQRHGQNLYKQNLVVYSPELAQELYSAEAYAGAYAKFVEGKVGAGRNYNQNVSSVSPSNVSQQADGQNTFDRYSTNAISERENFYHKPQAGLNWYAQLTDDALLSTVLYYSGGNGGGTGTYGDISWDYSTPTRVVDYDAQFVVNSGTLDRKGNEKAAGRSMGILRNSHNVQNTIGAISKLKYDISDAFSVEIGLDWRTAEIEHYRTVRDLLGGSYYVEEDNQVGLNDKIDYDFTNTVDWFGTYAQAEYVSNKVSLYGMAGYSTIKYSYVNNFTSDAQDTDNFGGYQVKGGALYNVTSNLGAFANVGIVSKAPIFDAVMNDEDGTLYDNPSNEQFVSFEAGLNYTAPTFAAKLNVYNTNWSDRTVSQSVVTGLGQEGRIILNGLDQLHQGIEAEIAYKPIEMIRVDLAAGLGNWIYTDDLSAIYKPNYSSDETVAYNLYVRDLKVGDQPQSHFSVSIQATPIDGLNLNLVSRTYGSHYAAFEPTSRTGSDDRSQSWQVPGYTVMDFHAGYNLRVGGVNATIFANVFNLLDEVYIQDAVDNSSFNAYDADGKSHAADDAEVFLGLPRNVNFGVTVRF